MRSKLVLPIAATMLFAACGQAVDEPDSAPTVEVTETTDVESVTVDSTEDLASPPGLAALSQALEQSSASQAYRVRMSIGMSIDLLGQQIEAAIDPDAPMMIVDVDAEGEQFIDIDMSGLTTAMAGAEAAGLGDMQMRQWHSSELIFIDASQFGAVVETGIFPAEKFSVDVTALGDATSADIARALTGQGAPDPSEMAEALIAALDSGELDLEPATGDEGTTFSGTIAFDDYARVMGQDPEAIAESTTGMLGQLPGLDFEQLLGTLYELDAQVEITVVDGAIDTFLYEIDMRDFLLAMLDQVAADIGEPLPIELREELRMVTTTLIDYDVDPTIDVQLPDPAEFTDATDTFLERFGALLGA